ncbi:hypothetical protein Tco_0262161 [Tanacetum coccineum]
MFAHRECLFDQLYAYLKQYEAHANEVRLMRERFPDPLALVANYHHTLLYYNNHQPQYNQSQYHQQLSPIAQQFYTSHQQPQSYDTPVPQQSYHALAINQPLVIHQQSYQAPTIPQQSPIVFPQLDLGLSIPSFLTTDDPIESLNKAIAFTTQETVQDNRVTVQNVQERQSQSFVGNGARGNATSTGDNRSMGINAANQTNAEESGVVLDEEKLAFLANPGVALGPDTQTTLLINVAFQTDDLDTFDLDCDDAPAAKAVFMANLFSSMCPNPLMNIQEAKSKLLEAAKLHVHIGLNTYLGKINTRVPISKCELSTLNSASNVVLEENWVSHR